MKIGILLTCFCISFVSLETSVFFAVLASNTDYNGCIEYNCTYTPKVNPNGKEDCWVSITSNNLDSCFLNKPVCPNTTVCWEAPGSLYTCLDDQCDALSPKISLWILCVIFAVIFIITISVTIYQFNKMAHQLDMYQRLSY